MAKRLFGTDGIRGVAGMEPLDPKTVAALGIALGDDLIAHLQAAAPVLLGIDTRESGPAIAAQLAWGLAKRGIRVEFAGVVTTPGVAYLTRTGGFAAGAMISASHNPYQDNGIKVFSRDGYKLPDGEEAEIEEEIFAILPKLELPEDFPALAETYSVRRYIDFIGGIVGARLDGIKVVMDCGNGAASAIAPTLFRELGATVEAIHASPDGRNINLNCGALHVEALRERVLETGADAGVAFDGDADRAMLVSKSGRVIDGDAMLLIAGALMQRDGHLPGNTVVATVMSNLGLEQALGRLGISMLRTPVGDKYVLEEMIRRDAPLGGEQSGHVIFKEFATTGDGMLTALKVLEAASREGKSLDELAADFTVLPQLLVNIRVKERRPLEQLAGVKRKIAEAEAELNGSGRVLVRFSGTEPLARVMVEGPELGQVTRCAEAIADAIRAELG